MAALPEPERPLAERLVAELFCVRAGDLLVGGLSVAALARTHGTPLYVYDAGILRARVRALKSAVAGFAGLCFSAKANPNPAVLRVFVEEGTGIEVASGAEYLRARAAGCAPERILFAGPGKSEEELALALEGGVGEIHVESFEEIERLAALARRCGRAAPVGIRINPAAAAQGGAMRMGGRASPFGFDEEILADVVRAVAAAGLDLTGLHLFAGTQILDADVLAGQWRHALALSREIARLAGRPPRTIDLGGGLGIPYFAGDGELDLDRLRAHAARLRAELGPLGNPAVVLEPGRWLAGPAGLYVAQVNSAKVSRGTRFAVLDGGLHHHLAASGNLGAVVKRDYPIVAPARMDEPAAGTFSVVGPLCTPLDTLGRQVPLPDLSAGDLVAVLQSGAYGLTASPVGFLGHPMPAEVLVEDGRARLVRPRGSFEAPLSQLPP
ncbi:MAG TPA: type III PLP-dependent enzyme [Beijerinckiaceae bacterium]|nr:type III PLP-dependent enzyme [Beijerinckiaceae bacterium]